jgi:hypothetical protein
LNHTSSHITHLLMGCHTKLHAWHIKWPEICKRHLIEPSDPNKIVYILMFTCKIFTEFSTSKNLIIDWKVKIKITLAIKHL